MNKLATLQGRQATFKTKPGWPHSHLPLSEMAMAGWYCRAVAASPDNVACYLCGKNLDGWTADDHPWREHVAHGKECPLVHLDVWENRERTFEHWPHAKPSSGQVPLEFVFNGL